MIVLEQKSCLNWANYCENMKIVSLNLSWKMCIIALKLVLLSLKLHFVWFEYMLESQILIFKITWFFRECVSLHSLGPIIYNWIATFNWIGPKIFIGEVCVPWKFIFHLIERVQIQSKSYSFFMLCKFSIDCCMNTHLNCCDLVRAIFQDHAVWQPMMSPSVQGFRISKRYFHTICQDYAMW